MVEASGKTRAQICKEAGVSQSYLSLMESGHRQVGLPIVARLAATLGVDPVDLRPDLASLLSVPLDNSQYVKNDTQSQAPAPDPATMGAE